MKKYILTLAIIFAFTGSKAQVIFNPDVSQSLSSPSVLLEFGTQPKGLLLPWVTNTAQVTDAVAGTLVYDVSDKKIKFLQDGSIAGWIDLSVDTTGVVDANLQNTPNDATNAKTIIGDRTSTVPGILVLDSPTKALVLPRVASPELNIISPSAGMMAYDTTAKQLAVFNGTVWSFWKEPVSYVPTVTSRTGRVWMDRNLGASQVATSATDAASLGDLYQWGRLKDGHETINSPTTSTLSTGDVPGDNNYITTSSAPNNWRETPNVNLWQGINGINNPCPRGFRIPTSAEFVAETALFSSQNTAGAFDSVLKLPLTSYRSRDGSYMPNRAYYWASDIIINSADELVITSTDVSIQSDSPGYGQSVRCIKD